MKARLLVALMGLMASLLVFGSVLALAALARDMGTVRVTDVLQGNTQAIATALRIRLDRALSLGIPVTDLVGVEPVFLEHLGRHREVSFFAMLDSQGNALTFTPSPALAPGHHDLAMAEVASQNPSPAFNAAFQAVRTPLRGSEQSDIQGWLVTGYPVNYIDQQVNAVVMDLLVAMLIATVLVIEIMRYAGPRLGVGPLWQFRAFLKQVQHGHLHALSPLAGAGRWGQAGQAMSRRIQALRQSVQALPQGVSEDRLAWGKTHGLLNPAAPWLHTAQPSRLRLMVFLTVLSDELVRPFMAVHASQMDGPLALSVQALAGIALTSFLFTWALSQPLGAALLRRYGSRRCLMSATACVALAMWATVWSQQWVLLVVCRAVTGAAFGFVLIFSQTAMLRLSRDHGRARAMADFVGAVVAAGICGPVIGGLMSVKLGVSTTFVASGLCAAAAWVLAAQQAAIPSAVAPGPPLSWASLAALLRNRRLMTLLLCSAIPGKLAATAVLLLVVPLAVADMGESASLTGRLLLLYFLAFWLVSGWAGRWSDARQNRVSFVVVGGLLSALGCWAGGSGHGAWSLVALCGLLGLGQAWLSSAQIVWATQLAEQDPAGTDGEVALGIYRLLERMGGALGPVVVAFLMGTQGAQASLTALGIALAAGSLITLIALGRANALGGEPGRHPSDRS